MHALSSMFLFVSMTVNWHCKNIEHALHIFCTSLVHRHVHCSCGVQFTLLMKFINFTIKPFPSGQFFSFFPLKKNRIVLPWERERSNVLSLCHRNEVVTIQQKSSPYYRQINTIHCSQDHLVPLGFFRFDVKHLDGNTKILSDWILQAWYHASWFYKLFYFSKHRKHILPT